MSSMALDQALYDSDSSEDVDEDLLSLHQSQTSSRTTLSSTYSPALAGAAALPGAPQSNNPARASSSASAVSSPYQIGAKGPGSCEHILSLLSDQSQAERLLKKHNALVRWGIRTTSRHVSSDGQLPPSKRRKVQVPSCSTCGNTLHRPFVCLECSYSGCWRQGHIEKHLDSTGHDFALDISSGSIYCAGCDDLIYHPDLDAAFNVARQAQARSRTKSRSHNPITISGRQNLLNHPSTQLVGCRGQKGILNLGASCYLSVVLQALIHNPLIRNWFLSDKHPNQLCNRVVCLPCEMDKVFSELYAPEPAQIALAPASFLGALWRTSEEIAGYAQHDAHEVLVAILNGIHSHSRSSCLPYSSMRSSKHNCNCIIHSAFGSQLQSDVRCGKCGVTKPTVDPILDISLELDQGSPENSLLECLRRYTRIEALGAKDQPFCGTCKEPSENATRRLTIRRLPPILCFQFKRFKHVMATAQKIDTPVRFPSSLNMGPFTTPQPQSSSSPNTPNQTPPSYPDSIYGYDLFAVVNHEGQMDTGHYTAFARHQDSWTRFDDDKVSSVDLSDVLLDKSAKERAYMCFYVRKELDYGTGVQIVTNVSDTASSPSVLGLSTPASAVTATPTSAVAPTSTSHIPSLIPLGKHNPKTGLPKSTPKSLPTSLPTASTSALKASNSVGSPSSVGGVTPGRKFLPLPMRPAGGNKNKPPANTAPTIIASSTTGTSSAGRFVPPPTAGLPPKPQV